MNAKVDSIERNFFYPQKEDKLDYGLQLIRKSKLAKFPWIPYNK